MTDRSFSVDESQVERLAEYLRQEYGEDATDNPTRVLSEMVQGEGADDPPVILSAIVAGETIEMVLHDSDDENECGFLLTIRPVGTPAWLDASTQLTSGYQESADLFDRDEDGFSLHSDESVAQALSRLVAEANRLLPYLHRLAAWAGPT